MRRILLPALFLALFLSFSLSAQDAAVNPRIQEILSTLNKTRVPTAAQLSPDGKYLAWTVGRQLHLTVPPSFAEDHTIAPPADGCALYSPTWSADSSKLAYLANCVDEKYPVIYIADSATRESRKLAAPQGSVTSMKWSPDGEAIGFLFVPNATRSAGATDAMKPAVGVIGRDNFEVQTLEAAFVKDGRVSPLLSTKDYIYEFSWSPDASNVVYISAPAPGENNWWVAKLFLQEVKHSYWCARAASEPCPATQTYPKPQLLVDPTTIPGPLHGLQIALPQFSPDGHDIAFIGGLMSDFGSTGGDLYIVKADGPYAGKDTHPFTAGRKASIAWFQWVDREHVLISERERGRVHIAILGTSGSQSPMLSRYVDGSISSGTTVLAPSVSLMGHAMAVVMSSFDHAPEVYWGLPQNLKQVSHLNDGLKPIWGKAESIEYKNDGFDIQGFLIRPAHYDPSKKYPLITIVHGGPASSYLPSWGRGSLGPEPLSAMDYFVFLPNPRGSYGQGEAFTQANRKSFGYGDLRDILAGIDVIEKKYPVDDNRLGITGWSYGGFMTMFAVTQTQRFHAAVAGAGISNWQSYYGQNSIDQWMVPYFGASVYDSPDVYAKSSAINYIKKAKTPMLIVVGDRDGECPAPQSFEMWHALRAQNVETELVVYPNEGHHFRDPAHSLDVLVRTMNWFDTHLK